jgi:DNA-binding transcriptional ArsR family regulator
MTILKILADQKPHQYSELKETTKLNSPTLTKHLKRLKDKRVITKYVDTTSGKYPYPVYYSANPAIMPMLTITLTLEKEMLEIEEIILDPKKDPIDVLDQLNVKNNTFVLLALEQYKNDKHIQQDVVEFFLELTIWYPYKILILKLLEGSKKIIDKIDVEKLLKRNLSTFCFDREMMLDAGLTEEEIEAFIKRMGRGGIIGGLGIGSRL